jgi:hypothetical protein
MEEKQYKEYLALAKQYQKQYQKPKQQHEQHHEQAIGNDYAKQVEIPLIAEEVDSFFWEKLVNLGWRINSQYINTFENQILNPPLKSVQFLYLCPDCGKSLHSQQAHLVTPSKARAMMDTNWLSIVVKKHKATSNGCVAPEYDENGEAILEA